MGDEILWRTRRAAVYKRADPGRPNWKSRLKVCAREPIDAPAAAGPQHRSGRRIGEREEVEHGTAIATLPGRHEAGGGGDL